MIDDSEKVGIWRKEAEQGSAARQFLLGFTYRNGNLGVTQDYAEAAKWYRMSAEQGWARAQYDLAVMYKNGQGMPKDYVQAYMWASLLAAQNKENARLRDEVKNDMTPEQLIEGQRLTSERIVPQAQFYDIRPAIQITLRSIVRLWPLWLIIGFLVWRNENPVMHDPVAEKAEEEKLQSERLEREIKYEQEFYANEQKAVNEGKVPPTIARVRAPNGGYVTGQWLFIPQCAKGILCAQPDGSLRDEKGMDWNAPPEQNPPEPSR